MSMEMRLLLAFLLMGAVMFLTPYFFKTAAAAAGQEDAAGHAGRRSRRRQPLRRRRPPAAEAAAAPAPKPPGRRIRARRPRQQAAAAVRHRYRPVPRRLQQPGRQRAQLAAQEIQGQRRQAAGAGQHRRRAWNYPFSLYFPGPAARRQGSTGPTTRRRADPDGLGVTYEFLRRPHRRPQDLPLPEEQLSGAGLDARSRSTASRCRT